MRRALRFTVFGRAQPAGSKRAFPIRRGGELTGRVAVADDNPQAKNWQAAVRDAAAVQLVGGEIALGPLEVRMHFFVARPKGHYGSGRNAELVKPSAPAVPTTRPDVLKLARGVEDALTGLVYADDAQIVTETLLKRYGWPERCEVELTPFVESMA